MSNTAVSHNTAYPCALGEGHHTSPVPVPPPCRATDTDRLESPLLRATGPRTTIDFTPTPWHHRLQRGRFQPAAPEAREYNGVPLAMHFDDVANALSVSAVAHGGQAIGGPVC